MPAIEPRLTASTRYATGTNSTGNLGAGRRQIGTMVTAGDFTKIKKAALSQRVSMSEIVRQCLDAFL